MSTFNIPGHTLIQESPTRYTLQRGDKNLGKIIEGFSPRNPRSPADWFALSPFGGSWTFGSLEHAALWLANRFDKDKADYEASERMWAKADRMASKALGRAERRGTR